MNLDPEAFDRTYEGLKPRAELERALRAKYGNVRVLDWGKRGSF